MISGTVRCPAVFLTAESVPTERHDINRLNGSDQSAELESHSTRERRTFAAATAPRSAVAQRFSATVLDRAVLAMCL